MDIPTDGTKAMREGKAAGASADVQALASNHASGHCTLYHQNKEEKKRNSFI